MPKKKIKKIKLVRHFGGKRFTLTNTFNKKSHANLFAGNAREEGVRARVIPYKKQWLVYCTG